MDEDYKYDFTRGNYRKAVRIFKSILKNSRPLRRMRMKFAPRKVFVGDSGMQAIRIEGPSPVSQELTHEIYALIMMAVSPLQGWLYAAERDYEKAADDDKRDFPLKPLRDNMDKTREEYRKGLKREICDLYPSAPADFVEETVDEYEAGMYDKFIAK